MAGTIWHYASSGYLNDLLSFSPCFVASGCTRYMNERTQLNATVQEIVHWCPVAKDDGFWIPSSIQAAWKLSALIQGFINSSLGDSLCIDPSAFAAVIEGCEAD